MLAEPQHHRKASDGLICDNVGLTDNCKTWEQVHDVCEAQATTCRAGLELHTKRVSYVRVDSRLQCRDFLPHKAQRLQGGNWRRVQLQKDVQEEVVAKVGKVQHSHCPYMAEPPGAETLTPPQMQRMTRHISAMMASMMARQSYPLAANRRHQIARGSAR